MSEPEHGDLIGSNYRQAQLAAENVHLKADRSQDYEDGALDALGYITDEREDLDDLTMRVAEKIGANIVAGRKRERERDRLRAALDDLRAHVQTVEAATIIHRALDSPPAGER